MNDDFLIEQQKQDRTQELLMSVVNNGEALTSDRVQAALHSMSMMNARQSGKSEAFQTQYDQLNELHNKTNPYGIASEVSSISADSLREATTWRSDTVGSSRPTFTSTRVEPKENKEKAIAHILNIRNKLAEFLDGSNLLLNILDPQSVRETVKELRWEYRNMKINKGLSEMDIIKYQEDMYETRIDDRSIDFAEYDKVPF